MLWGGRRGRGNFVAASNRWSAAMPQPKPRGYSGREEMPQSLLNFRPVLANRDVLALIVGYAAAIWGCVGLRQWIVVFLTFRAGDQAADPAQALLIALGPVHVVAQNLPAPEDTRQSMLREAMLGLLTA